jgi:hypothetical protein
MPSWHVAIHLFTLEVRQSKGGVSDFLHTLEKHRDSCYCYFRLHPFIKLHSKANNLSARIQCPADTAIATHCRVACLYLGGQDWMLLHALGVIQSVVFWQVLGFWEVTCFITRAPASEHKERATTSFSQPYALIQVCCGQDDRALRADSGHYLSQLQLWRIKLYLCNPTLLVASPSPRSS